METQKPIHNKKTRFDFIPNGPVRVSGPFELKDAAGKTVDTPPEIFLCTCGNPRTNPFVTAHIRTNRMICVLLGS